jgi:carbamoyltransferase
MSIDGQTEMTWELESIFDCGYPSKFNTLYKHQGGRGPWRGIKLDVPRVESEDRGMFELVLDDTAGITKAYEAVTQYCGWAPIEAGKTMGLFPYGKENSNIPPVYTDAGGQKWRSADRNLVIPTYPNGAKINEYRYTELETPEEVYMTQQDVTLLQSRRDLAYAVQTQSQREVLTLIKKAVEISGNKNVILSGGYGLNCVANYFYLTELNELGINLYVEPISSDAGTCIGAALMVYHQHTNAAETRSYADNLYLGPKYEYTKEQIQATAEKYNATSVHNASNEDVVKLLREKNIVALFQGRSESGPRALGNRSILFDPSVLDGKDYVNSVKHREYFRPFAGSIMAEHAHEWFDLRGMKESPTMMYAVNCQPGVEEKIPSVIHIDGTCRIQTVTVSQNPFYYSLISDFYKQSGIPMLFNTSFNLGGEPLVETLDDALRTLANSDIEYLYLPEYSVLIKVAN